MGLWALFICMNVVIDWYDCSLMPLNEALRVDHYEKVTLQFSIRIIIDRSNNKHKFSKLYFSLKGTVMEKSE